MAPAQVGQGFQGSWFSTPQPDEDHDPLSAAQAEPSNSDLTRFSGTIHILESSGRSYRKLRLFQTLSARQVKSSHTKPGYPDLQHTKTIKKQTLVHNLQKKNPEKKYKIRVILHPNRLQVRGKCKATSDHTKEKAEWPGKEA